MTRYNSNYDLTLLQSDICAQFHLTTAGGVDTYTVPGTSEQKYSARFSYASNSNVFVCLNAAPTIPGASAVGVQPYNEFKPGADGSQRQLKGGDVIHLLTPDTTAYCGVSLREIE